MSKFLATLLLLGAAAGAHAQVDYQLRVADAAQQRTPLARLRIW
jgi:hypothetical protein